MSIVDYYAVSHRIRRAVWITDDKGMLAALTGPEDDEPVELLPDYEVPIGYKQCGGEMGGRECSDCAKWEDDDAARGGRVEGS